MVVLVLIFRGQFMLFSIEDASIVIATDNVQIITFIHILTKAYYLLSFW